jgi:predicted amidophosphoribosyltransferase
MKVVLTALRSWIFPSSCASCDRPGTALCARCAPAPSDAVRFAIDGVPAYALGPYEGALRAAVVAMKRGERDPLTAFAGLLDRAPIDGVLVPLPTTRRRAGERGFDQSVALGRLIARRRTIACAELLEKHGGAQAGRGRRERLAAGGRFRLRRGVNVPPLVTVFDDVCTTGATLRDALGVLRGAGAAVAGIVVLARAGGTQDASGRS